MDGTRRRLVWHALPALVVLLALTQHALLLTLLRAVYWLFVRMLQLVVVLLGSGSFWWVLRSYQLQKEQELYDQAWSKFNFYQRYRHRSSSGGGRTIFNGGNYGNSNGGPILDAGFQLRAGKRLPIGAHLRTSWNLPQEICDEIALFVQLAIRDYVSYWFQPISAINEDFPSDLKFLLADLLGALTARVLEIDSSQALAIGANAIEMLRLHLGWFREAYAQLEEDFPEVFQGDESDENLQKRQEYVAAFAQKSQFLHPGCVTAASVVVSGTSAPSSSTAGSSSTSSSRKPGLESPEVIYLRHVAAQVLVQLKPELGHQYETNLFVSMVMNFMREAATFKIFKPMAEYSQPRYANELVLAALQSFLVEKDTVGPLSPNGNAVSSSTGGVGMTLNKLRLTKSFLYKATRRSGEQAEAAFQAVVDAVSSAASSATGGSVEVVFDGEDWTDAANYAFSSTASSYSAATPNNNIRSNGGSGHERKQPFALLFHSLDDRISIPRASRLKTPRAFLPGSSSGPKPSGNGTGGGHIDDLKNMKANIGSSLDKVKRRFRTLSGHPNDPETPGSAGGFAGSTQVAARMMKKPGMLFQKALRRGDGGPLMMMSPMSPTTSLDEVLTPPPLTEDDLNLSGGDSSEPPSPTRAANNSVMDTDGGEEFVECDDRDGEEEHEEDEESSKPPTIMRERVVQQLDKSIASYVKMCQERPEMRSSARSRELYEFLTAMEDFFMLGFADSSVDADEDEMMMAQMPFVSPRGPGMESNTSSGNGNQQYWTYLAQDRPETPFLNEHWKFVSTKCPQCVANDSFCSTRGVQWILVALEKGMLWEYVTALHLNQKPTERFYDSEDSVFRSGKLMEGVLKSLFQLNKLKIALEIPYLLGRKSDMDEAFGVTSSSSSSSSTTRANRSFSNSKTSVRILESVWEVERYVPIHGWTKTQDKRWHELPSSEWIWEGDWTLEAKKPLTVSSSVDSALDADALNGQVWEYAKTFEDRFHDKEKKFDSVRRRKWVRRRRQLPPVLTSDGPIPHKPASIVKAVTVSSPPPALFGAASLPVAATSTVISLGKVRNIKHFFDSSKRGKAKTDDTAVVVTPSPRTLMKRRSSSFDKSILSSPIAADLALALESPDKLSLTPNKTVSPVKKKRGSIPSLRRSSTASSEKEVKSVLALTRSTTTGSTLAVDEGSGNRRLTLDVDDDDSICFRCLMPLQMGTGAFTSCQSCQQRVCSTCHNFFAFLVFPPPLEASKKAQVCGSCYDRLTSKYKLKIEAHVSKYFTRERDRDNSVDGVSLPSTTSNVGTVSHGNGSAATAQANSAGGSGSEPESTNASALTPSNSSKSAVSKFEITVFVKDEASYAWAVVKTFQDFEVLEKKLHEKLKKQEKKHGAGCHACHWKGVDYMELLAVEPSLKKLPVAALSYDKRLYVLEEFVQSLLACDTLCQSPVVQKFFSLSNAMNVGAATNASHQYAQSTTANGLSNSSEYRSESMSPTAAVGSSFSAPGSNNPALMMENGKWRKGKWVAPETSSKETKMRILQKLEVSLFAVVGEVFEFDGIGMVRRQLFAMSRSFIKAFLSASHFRKLEKQYLSFTDAKKMAAMIVDFREYMFPDPEAPAPPVPPATLSAQEMQALRKDALDAILASFPSTLVSLFGETSCENAALKLHEFLQHEVFVKNLLFSVVDEVLLHLFPDFATYKSSRPSTAK